MFKDDIQAYLLFAGAVLALFCAIAWCWRLWELAGAAIHYLNK